MAKQEEAKPATPAWPIEFTLSRPVDVFGDTYTKLSLREPTAADLLKFGVFDDQISGDSALDMIAHLSGTTPATVRALPGPDMLRLSRRLLGSFL